MKKRQIDISLILPCLNEAQALPRVLTTAQTILKEIKKKSKLSSEVIVVDNGSSDGSEQIARKFPVKLVRAQLRGYGSAYQTGINIARGDCFILCDSDGSYDLGQIPKFVTAQKQNRASLILGSRFLGIIKPGAMPFLNRYIGNPLLTGLVNLTYGTQISDAHTGLRLITKRAVRSLRLKSRGMEFASEMIIKAHLLNLPISEVPIIYYPRIGASKLDRFSDALRHIRFILCYAPTYLFILPGAGIFLAGLITTLLLTPDKLILPWFTLDTHTLTIGVLATNLGLQIGLLGFFARLYTQLVLKLPGGRLGNYLLKKLTSEHALVSGLVITLLSSAWIAGVGVSWIDSGFGPLTRLREVIVAAGAVSVGAQLLFASFLISLFQDSS